MSIDKIELKNIQAHKDSSLELGKGITVLLGESEVGKSSILKGFLHNVLNTRQNLVSNSIKTPKGNINGTSSVTLWKGDDYVTRERSRKKIDGKFEEFNGYRTSLAKDPFKATKGEVPSQIETFFNLNEVNLQAQDDGYFLIGSTGGEVAKYLNKIVNLSQMDGTIANCERLRRATNKAIQDKNKDIEEKQQVIASLAWVAPAEKLIEKYISLTEEEQEIQKVIQDIEPTFMSYTEVEEKYIPKAVLQEFESSILKLQKAADAEGALDKEIQEIEDSIQTYEGISIVEPLLVQELGDKVEELQKLLGEEEGLDKEIQEYTKLMQQYLSVKTIDTSLLAELHEGALALQKKVEEDVALDKEIQEIEGQMNEFIRLSSVIRGNEGQMEELKEQLPDVCPTCGQIWDKEGFDG